MFFLIISIAASAMISIVMRFSQERITGKFSMLCFNYLACIIASWCFLEPKTLLPSGDGVKMTLLLGIIEGALYLLNLALSQYSISKNGVILPSVFSRIGALMVPFVMSVIFFREQPLVQHLIGAAIAAAAIIIMSGKNSGHTGSLISLILLFFSDGIASSMSKVYDEVGNAQFGPHFLLYTFGTAFVICTLIAVYKKERFGIMEAACGILVGIPNYFASRFLLLALSDIPAVIAYPIRSVGTIVIISLAGLFAFRERLSRRQWAATVLILISVVLLSI